MRKILFLIICFMSVHELSSQITFEKSYELEGSGYQEYGMSVMQDDEGRYVSVAYCNYYDYDFRRTEVFRTDEYGEFIDHKVFSNSTFGFKADFEVLPGNYGGNAGYVVGTSTSTNPSVGSNYGLMYRDLEFLNDKSSTIHIRDYDIMEEVILTAQNTFLLLGYSFDENDDTVLYIGEHSDSLHWIEYDVFSSAYDVVPRSAAQLSDGSYLITGYASVNASGRPLYVARFSTDIELIWEKTFDVDVLAMNNEYPVCVHGDEIGIVHTVIEHPLNHQVQLLRINADGDSLNYHLLAEGLEVSCLDLLVEDNGDIVMTGYEELDGLARKTFLLRTDLDGNIAWKRFFFVNASAAGMSVANTQDGGYIIAGFSRWPDPIPARPFLIKTNEEGISTWVRTLEYQENLSICPNPASSSIRINLPNVIENANVIIYSSSGKEVLSKKNYTTAEEIMIEHLADGLYVLTINSGNEHYSSKFIKR